MTRIGFFLMWLLHFLPLAVLARIGQALGLLLWAASSWRRQVANRNLIICFPELPAAARQKRVRAHFMSVGRAILERGIVWWGSPQRIRRIIRIKGMEHWQAAGDRPVIWLVPHFSGLDMGAARLGVDYPLVALYARQTNKVADAVLYRGRTRFGKAVMLARQDGIRPVLRCLRQGLPLYYLPDQDLGPRDSVFVPFFGLAAATITGLPRLARLANAVVIPLAVWQRPGGAGYEIEFFPMLADFPGKDDAADAARMNGIIEALIRRAPEQYYWLHRRFKTRPPGEADLYD